MDKLVMETKTLVRCKELWHWKELGKKCTACAPPILVESLKEKGVRLKEVGHEARNTECFVSYFCKECGEPFAHYQSLKHVRKFCNRNCYRKFIRRRKRYGER